MRLVDQVRMPLADLCYGPTLRFQFTQEVCVALCGPFVCVTSRHERSLVTKVAWLQQIQSLQEIQSFESFVITEPKESYLGHVYTGSPWFCSPRLGIVRFGTVVFAQVWLLSDSEQNQHGKAGQYY